MGLAEPHRVPDDISPYAGIQRALRESRNNAKFLRLVPDMQSSDPLRLVWSKGRVERTIARVATSWGDPKPPSLGWSMDFSQFSLICPKTDTIGPLIITDANCSFAKFSSLGPSALRRTTVIQEVDVFKLSDLVNPDCQCLFLSCRIQDQLSAPSL